MCLRFIVFNKYMYDLIIIGGGPAGVAGGVYAARKKMKSALIAESFGGQSIVSADIQNWIGTKSISGFDLAKNLEEHLRAHEGIEIIDGERVSRISKKENAFAVTTESGKEFETKTVLLVSGSRRKKLDVPGEKELDGKGVAYCSICDAPIFKGNDVAVVGGGNAGLEAVIDLLPYAKEIYIIHRGTELKGDSITQEKIFAHKNVHVIYSAETREIVGNGMVTGLIYFDKNTSETITLPVQGVFVEVGIIPNSDMVKDFVKINELGMVITDPKNQRTSVPGIWAAGDVTDETYRQNNISVGDAIKAVLDIYDTIHIRGTDIHRG